MDATIAIHEKSVTMAIATYSIIGDLSMSKGHRMHSVSAVAAAARNVQLVCED